MSEKSGLVDMWRVIVVLFCIVNIFTSSETISETYEKGQTVTLKCNQTGNIQWLKNNETVGSSKIFTIDGSTISFVVDKVTVGKYVCKSGENIEEHEVFVKPTPDPENKNEKNAIYGETFVYDCKGFGYPQPRVTWLKDGEPLNGSNSRIVLRDSNGLLNNSLRINFVQYDDAGVYTCLAENIFGNFTVGIKVNVKDQFAALWPFFGICVEVIILCAIIFIYEKRKSKKAQDEQQREEADQLTSNNDRTAEELRQRKV